MRWFARGLVSIALVIAATPARAVAQDDDLSTMSLDELLEVEVDVGSMASETIFRSPSSVTVISRDMIEAYGFRTVAEALDTIAGFDAVRTYSTRNIPTIRGLLNFHYANKVLLLIDGVPTWSAVTGHTSLERVSIDAVERIEILRGPASVLYGSNAYAGAINIVLRRDALDGGVVHAWAGAEGEYAGGGTLFAARRGVGLFLSIEAYDEGEGEPYRFIDEDGVGGKVYDFERGGDGVVSVRYGGHRLLVNRYVYQYMRFGTTATFADGAGHDQIQRGTLADYDYHRRWRDTVDVVGSVAWDDNERNFDRSADGELRTNERGWRLTGTLGTRVDVRDDLYLEAGAAAEQRKSEEYRNYRVSDGATVSENNMTDRSVWEASLFGQVGYAGERLSALAGTRLTDNERFGLDLSSRSTISYALADTHALKLVVGQAFRAPSLFELYFTSDTGTVLGNLDLDPEQSTSVELTDVLGVGPVLAQTTVYYARYRDIIYRELVDEVNVYRNSPTIDAVGVELQLEYRASLGRAFASAAYVADLGPQDLEGAYDILHFAPPLIGDAGVATAVGPADVDAVVHYRSATDGPDSRVGFAWTVDAGVAHRFQLAGHPAELRLDLRNLTDEIVYFPEYVRRGPVNAIPRDGFGRQILLGLRWSL